MTALLQNLQSDVLHRDVKPHILSAFGDIALAIQSKFEPYLTVVMNVLEQATKMRASSEEDYDMIDYVNVLRNGILEAYTGITQGFKMDGKGQILLPYVQSIFEFLHVVALDQNRDEDVTRGAVGLIGDLADALGYQVKSFVAQDWIDALLKQARAGRGMTASTKEVSKWTKAIIRQIIAS